MIEAGSGGRRRGRAAACLSMGGGKRTGKRIGERVYRGVGVGGAALAAAQGRRLADPP